MVGYLHSARRSAGAVAAALIAFLGLVASYAGVHLAGTKTGTVLAVGAVTAPLLLGLSLFAPMIFPFGLYAMLTPFDTILLISSASTVTKLLGLLSAGAFIFFILRTKRFADPDRSVAVWLLYTLWLTSSLFWAIDPKLSMQMLPTALSLFALYAVVSLVRINLETLHVVSRFVMAGGAAASAYALYLYHSGVAIKEQRMWLATGRVDWNPDHLAAAMLLPLAIAIMSCIFGRTLWTRAAGLGCIGIILPTLVLTGARGPELGLLVLLGYLILRDPQRVRLAVPVAAAFAIGAALAAPTLVARWSDAVSSGGAGRTDIWHVGWLAFKQNWLFGAGFNNFPLAYDRAMLHVFQPQFIGWDRQPHDILVGISVELGIIGVSLLLLGWFTQFRTLRTIAPDDPRYRMRLLLEASLLGLFVAGLFADVMLTKYVWLAFIMVSLTRNALPLRSPAAASTVPTGVPVNA